MGRKLSKLVSAPNRRATDGIPRATPRAQSPTSMFPAAYRRIRAPLALHRFRKAGIYDGYAAAGAGKARSVFRQM